jgi:hypothetical protein
MFIDEIFFLTSKKIINFTAKNEDLDKFESLNIFNKLSNGN